MHRRIQFRELCFINQLFNNSGLIPQQRAMETPKQNNEIWMKSHERNHVEHELSTVYHQKNPRTTFTNEKIEMKSEKWSS
jgi:hypothetical protein